MSRHVETAVALVTMRTLDAISSHLGSDFRGARGIPRTPLGINVVGSEGVELAAACAHRVAMLMVPSNLSVHITLLRLQTQKKSWSGEFLYIFFISRKGLSCRLHPNAPWNIARVPLS